MNPEQDRAYRAPGTIEQLHYHKMGQEKARYCALFVVVLGTVMLIVGWFTMRSDIGSSQKLLGYAYTGNTGRSAGHTLGSSTGGTRPISPDRFRSGYIGRVKILRDMPAEPPSLDILPGLVSISIEPESDSMVLATMIMDNAVSSEAGDGWGLPGRSPLWHYALSPRRYWDQPEGIAVTSISTPSQSKPPHAQLLSPAWPRDVRFLWDTVVVEGIVTLHSSGLISFVLTRESHPDLGFADEVQRAMARSTCYPAIDENGNRISVRCPFRCVFDRDAKSEVWVDWSPSDKVSPYKGRMTATVRQ